MTHNKFVDKLTRNAFDQLIANFHNIFPKKHKTSDNKEKYFVFDQEKLKEYMKKNLYWEIMDNESSSTKCINKNEVKDYMHLMFDVKEVKIGKKCIKKIIVPDSDDSDGSDT